MKRIWFLYIFMLILIISCDNEGIEPVQSETFVKFYGAGLEDDGVQVLTTSTGYLVLANLENPGRGKDICIIQTDDFGNSVAPMTIIGGNFDDEAHVIKANENGYVVAGTTQRFENSDKDVILIQLSQDGTLGEGSWQKIMGTELFDEVAYDLIVAESGNIVVAGYKETTDGLDMLLIETSAAGDSILMASNWAPNDEIAHGITTTENEYLLIGTEIGNFQGTSATHVVYCLRWTGSLVGIPFRPRLAGQGNAEGVSVAKSGSGDYYLACNVNPVGTSLSEVHIVNFDESFRNDVSENRVYGEYNISTVSELKIKDNSLYLAGTCSPDRNDRGYMYLVSAGLDNSETLYHYGGDGVSYSGNGFDFSSDGGFIITGANYINSQQRTIAICKIQ